MRRNGRRHGQRCAAGFRVVAGALLWQVETKLCREYAGACGEESKVSGRQHSLG